MERIKLFFSDVWVFIKPMIMYFLTKTGQIVLTIAIESVKDLATQDLSSSDKRNLAFNKIKSELKLKGLDVQESVINSAIEAAVQYIKVNHPRP